MALRVLALVASVGAIAALWLGERQKANYDLQLIVQSSARPGAEIAVRALLLGGIEAVQGPRLEPAPVQLSLQDASEVEIARLELTPDALGGMGGQLRVPEVPDGSYVLEAVAHPEGGQIPARCRTILRVGDEATGLEPRGRMAGPLQHLSLGPIRATGDAEPPSALDVRVPGGACIPEQPCAVWLRAGTPGAALSVEPSPSVGVEGEPRPVAETEGLVQVRLVVHGPEAEVRVRAHRAGKRVAERSVRLPVALGEVGLSVERPVLEPGQAPRYRVSLPPGRTSLLLDTYHEGGWRFTGGVASPPVERFAPWPPGDLADGLWQLQARADPFTTSSAGARLVYVRPPGMSDEALLRALDAAGAEVGEAPVFAAGAPLPTWALGDLQDTASYLLAPREQRRFPQPAAVSGRPAQLRRLSRTRNLLRFSVAAMLLLSAFVVSATMVRRELTDQEVTRRALREAGDVTIDTPLNRRRQAFWLWSMALGVALAFVLAALLIVAKPLWF